MDDQKFFVTLTTKSIELGTNWCEMVVSVCMCLCVYLLTV